MIDQSASRLIVGAPDSITHLLSQPSWEQWDVAVIVLSRLMAADAYVLAPVAERLSDVQTPLRDLAARRLDLERSLVALFGRVHGDARVAGLQLPDVLQRTLSTARQYLAVRDDLAREILGALDDDAAAKLAGRWSDAVTNGATRPHPWLAGRHTPGAIGFRWTRLWDRMRDALDSRPTGSRAA
jgi:hypothetical protein